MQETGPQVILTRELAQLYMTVLIQPEGYSFLLTLTNMTVASIGQSDSHDRIEHVLRLAM